MSYILEALQKSESERHQEKLPGHLAQSRPMLYSRNSKRQLWPIILTILLICNMLGMAYFFLYKDRSSNLGSNTENVGVPSEQAQADPVVDPHEKTESPVKGNASSLDDEESSDSAVDSSITTTGETASVEDPLALARAAIAKKREESRQATLAKAPGTMSDGSSASAAHWDGAANVEEAVLITPGGKKRGAAVPVASSGNVQESDSNWRTAEAPIAKEESPVDESDFENSEYPSIKELAKSFQQRVPALVFNSHIYSSDPQGRRIMINNNYLREGQSFSGIQVLEITENGVVLKKDGQPFRVSVVRNWSPES
ncbi:general secretion pathway protein GspB [Hahella ganghwensis]|uniref:general secretion pathway protein GspB n=1 Tax=Hahella ganghwensis TaxID=286420 RepID=UPI0003642FD9|nr:general secretion pathway protein GspB [Hahella ganghwensis]